MRLKSAQRGDTLVEVLLATVVISIVLSGAFAISSKALRINQNAQERTEVSNKMREQAEIIRSLAINQSSQAWADLKNRTNTAGNGVYFNFLSDPTNPNGGVRDPGASDYVQNYDPVVGTDSYGARGVVDIFDIWIERDTSRSVAGEYLTFIVKAQWDGIGDNGIQKSGLTLRVEDK